MKKVLLIASFLFLFSSTKVFAESQYVLPYPASMPGSKFYLLQEFKNTALQYWYFGNFGQFTYNLKQSDKFLVEAKILFEYKQYLLAEKALKKSDYFLLKIPNNLYKARSEKKNISQKKELLQEALLKHIEVLNSLKKELPDNFTWKPEKSSSTMLTIGRDIEDSIRIRLKLL